MSDVSQQQRLILVTGPSGAGRSTAIGALEDLGCETIDNLPLSLIPRLLDGPPLGRSIALGVDVRNRDFSSSALIELIDTLTADPRVALEVMFLDCRTEVLERRYSETRRRHPLFPAEPPLIGILRETDLLAPIKVRADLLIDTSEFTPHDLKAEVAKWMGATPAQRMAVSLQSFSYKRGVPRGVDMVFDCRFLRNPYWVPALRKLDGRSSEVAAYVSGDPRFAEFFDRVSGLIGMLLPAHIEEGKAHLTIGFGCTGGQHRSVAVAEKLGDTLEQAGWQISRRHRELERMPTGAPALAARGPGGGQGDR
ncbi:RNase adapter RapZ [Gemmobacter nectariphilus]|uniref:RNase adapter RapZ n=1 Tax=Gemmobacter nectariphilus TaxID=220343 RepID=UPI00040B5100|nr:RNase adapter RapZ [Gemmobacter nectariphilus]